MRTVKAIVSQNVGSTDAVMLGDKNFQRARLVGSLESLRSTNKIIFTILILLSLAVFFVGMFGIWMFGGEFSQFLTLTAVDGSILFAAMKFISKSQKENVRINILLSLAAAVENDDDYKYILKSMLKEL